MKFVIRIIAVLLFIVFFDFALKNVDEVVLHFFLGYELRGPLILLLLLFFILGAVSGVLAMMPTLLRYRRSPAKDKKIAEMGNVLNVPLEVPPQPDRV